jgi:HSP20 family protein
MTLTRWDPFGETTSLRRAMDRLFDESFVGWSMGSSGQGGSVPLDVIERDDAFVVKASLPGVKPDDVELSVHRNMLTIRGEMGGESEKSEGQYRHRERWQGSFSRSVSLPADVNTDACEARFEKGVLTVTLPKSEQARAKRINITADRPAIEGEQRKTGNGAKQPQPAAARQSS